MEVDRLMSVSGVAVLSIITVSLFLLLSSLPKVSAFLCPTSSYLMPLVSFLSCVSVAESTHDKVSVNSLPPVKYNRHLEVYQISVDVGMNGNLTPPHDVKHF